MDGRIGLGPVYDAERRTRCRRWQTYVWRSIFGAGLLSALIVVWFASSDVRGLRTHRGHAIMGSNIAFGLFGMQLALVMLAAPAATAAAICLEKQRGTLTHVLVTDLSDAEIVLGKLAARLGPVLALVAATLPVLGLASLLGGIQPESIFAAALISIGMAVLGCTLALTFSIWMTKTQEVLVATYGILGIWLLLGPTVKGLGLATSKSRWTPPGWVEWTDPFQLIFRPLLYPGSSNLFAGFVFLAVCFMVSVALAFLSIVRLRPVAANPKQPQVKKTRIAPGGRIKIWDRLPSPSLDGNPVLWREWRRSRLSRSSKIFLTIYYGLSLVLSAIVIWPVFNGGMVDNTLAAWVNAMVANVGLLLLCITASTALAEERVRDSLDVLLVTPLSTREILRGKWWGAARSLPRIAILPTLVSIAIAVRLGYLWSWMLMPLYILCSGAAIVSLGIALATWQPKVSRAIAICVSLFLAVTAGWLFLAIFCFDHHKGMSLGFISPFFALAEGTYDLGELKSVQWKANMGPMMSASMLWAFVSVILYVATLATFNRAFGRVSESSGARSAFRRVAFQPAPRASEVAEPGIP